MNVGVFLHIRFLVESLPAVLAGVRPRIGVDQQVGGKCAGPLERLSALLALENFLHAVHGPGSRGNMKIRIENNAKVIDAREKQQQLSELFDVTHLC